MGEEVGRSGVVGGEIRSVGAGDIVTSGSCGAGVGALGVVGGKIETGAGVGESVTIGRSSSYSTRVSSSVKSNERGPSVKEGTKGVGTVGLGFVGVGTVG